MRRTELKMLKISSVSRECTPRCGTPPICWLQRFGENFSQNVVFFIIIQKSSWGHERRISIFWIPILSNSYPAVKFNSSSAFHYRHRVVLWTDPKPHINGFNFETDRIFQNLTFFILVKFFNSKAFWILLEFFDSFKNCGDFCNFIIQTYYWFFVTKQKLEEVVTSTSC